MITVKFVSAPFEDQGFFEDPNFMAEDQLAGLECMPGFIMGYVEGNRCVSYFELEFTQDTPLPVGITHVNLVFGGRQ